jgi:hypothetical protein
MIRNVPKPVEVVRREVVVREVATAATEKHYMAMVMH